MPGMLGGVRVALEVEAGGAGGPTTPPACTNKLVRGGGDLSVSSRCGGRWASTHLPSSSGSESTLISSSSTSSSSSCLEDNLSSEGERGGSSGNVCDEARLLLSVDVSFGVVSLALAGELAKMESTEKEKLFLTTALKAEL